MLSKEATLSNVPIVTLSHEWPVEFRLVVAAARLELATDDHATILALLRTELDWDAVHRLAIQHGTLALLHTHLMREFAQECTASVLNQQRDTCSRATTKNLFLLGELSRIQSACVKRGVRLMTFKGPALAAEAYGSLALRTFNDIDLLIHPAEYESTRQSLYELGYSLDPKLDDAQQSFKLSQKGTLTFRSPSGGYVDLHTHLLDPAFPFPANFDELWERRRNIDVAGVNVVTMAHEDLCVYLAVHGAKHQWGLVGWVLDLALLMEAASISEWTSVERRAQALGQSRLLTLGVNVARAVLGTERPTNDTARGERDDLDQRLVDMAHRLSKAMGNEKIGESPLAYVRYQYQCCRSIRGVLRLSESMLFQPHLTDWQFMRLPRPLWACYLLLRPMRLLMVRLFNLRKHKSRRRES